MKDVLFSQIADMMDF